jgi:hypothetical protein
MSGFGRGHGCGSGHERCLNLPRWELVGGMGVVGSA